MPRFNGFLSQLEREIAQLNDHLPHTKKTLSHLLEEKAPSFSTRAGQSSAVRVEELKYLEKLVPKIFHDKIMLPFTILRRTSMGRGVHTIGGSKLDQFTVLLVIGKVKASFETWQETELPRSIYSPEVALLRKKLPTTVTIGFGV